MGLRLKLNILTNVVYFRSIFNEKFILSPESEVHLRNCSTTQTLNCSSTQQLSVKDFGEKITYLENLNLRKSGQIILLLVIKNVHVQ